MQKLMLEQATQKQDSSDDYSDEDDAADTVTQQDLKEYSKKLQVSLQLRNFTRQSEAKLCILIPGRSSQK